jgi:hypothetical protein
MNAAPQIKIFCAEMPRSNLKIRAENYPFLRRNAAQQTKKRAEN